MDAKNKQIANLVSSATSSPITFTYSELRKLLDRILAAPYWANQQQQQATTVVDNNHVAVDQTSSSVDVQLTEQVQNDVHQQLDNQLEHHDQQQTAAMLGKMSLHSHDEQLQYQQHAVLEQGRWLEVRSPSQVAGSDFVNMLAPLLLTSFVK